MKKHTTTTAVIFGAILLITGFAFANGRGYHMMDGYGNYHMMDGYGGYHMMNGYDGYHHMNGWNMLSVENQKRMQENMDNFHGDTRGQNNEYTRKQGDSKSGSTWFGHMSQFGDSDSGYGYGCF